MKRKKYRVIVNGISFYTSKEAIINGVGDSMGVNYAVSEAWKRKEYYEGIATTVTYNRSGSSDIFNVQITSI